MRSVALCLLWCAAGELGKVVRSTTVVGGGADVAAGEAEDSKPWNMLKAGAIAYAMMTTGANAEAGGTQGHGVVTDAAQHWGTSLAHPVLAYAPTGAHAYAGTSLEAHLSHSGEAYGGLSQARSSDERWAEQAAPMQAAPMQAAPMQAAAIVGADGAPLQLRERVRFLGTNQVGTIGRLRAANGYTGSVRFDVDDVWMREHATAPYKHGHGGGMWIHPDRLTHEIGSVREFPYVQPSHGHDADGVPFGIGNRVRNLVTNQVGTIGELYSASGDTGSLRFDIDSEWMRKYATKPYRADGGVMWLRPEWMTHVVGSGEEFPYIPPRQGYDSKGVPFLLWDRVRSKATGKVGTVMMLRSLSGDTGNMRVDWDMGGRQRLVPGDWLAPSQLEHADLSKL